MTPKEKAKELVDKFMNCDNMIFLTEGARECALIAVDEIIKSFYLNTGSDIIGNHVINFAIRESDYWQDVKREIELL
jgi:hypothetical protein